MTVTQEQAKNFETFIDSFDFFYVTGHKEPDGDSIASTLGIVALLKKKNKAYQLISVGPFKRPEIKKFEKYYSKEPDKNHFDKKSALIMVDCSENERIGLEICDQFKDFPRFIIDHHKTASAIDNSIIYPDSPAAAYLVLQLYEQIIGKPDLELANNLFFGICTDTGFFRFLNSDSSQVFKAVARLVEIGCNPRETYTEMNSGKPFSTRKLLGIMLDRAKQYYDGKLIVTYETMKDTQAFGKNGRDSDSLYSLLLSVEGVEAVLFIRQESANNCTAGFRSKDDVDVSKVAAAFGGGGHKNASGLSTTGKIDKLMPKIIAEFSKVF
ncbi:MAG: bifunctional oligoribonuclease/PAP phosphatase NrnA [Treponemataceae bacterium]|nr:bifunctional oligoribonuclease/PAP phosphatase NrnA [Treponemataceae bacterium]